VAYRFQYTDGMKGAILLMNGVVGDISVAAALHGAAKPVSTLCYLKPRELCNFFSPLARHAETLFATGRA
jgi:hypothetical protein